MANLQADVPEEHHQGFDVLGQGLWVARGKDQHVDVRCRVEFAAPVSADGDQAGFGVQRQKARPRTLQDGIGEIGGLPYQQAGARTLVESLSQQGVRLTDLGLVSRQQRFAGGKAPVQVFQQGVGHG